MNIHTCCINIWTKKTIQVCCAFLLLSNQPFMFSKWLWLTKSCRFAIWCVKEQESKNILHCCTHFRQRHRCRWQQNVLSPRYISPLYQHNSAEPITNNNFKDTFLQPNRLFIRVYMCSMSNQRNINNCLIHCISYRHPLQQTHYWMVSGFQYTLWIYLTSELHEERFSLPQMSLEFVCILKPITTQIAGQFR